MSLRRSRLIGGGFQNTDWPALFADILQGICDALSWVRYFTPINELFIAALFSAQYGWWNERISSDRGFVRALVNLCRANTLAMHAILKVQPDAIFIQSESSEYFHPESPSSVRHAAFLNEKRFLSLDLTYGHQLGVSMYEYLLDNGITREEYHWFLDNHVKESCVMGNDYYVTNEHTVHDDGTTSWAGEIFSTTSSRGSISAAIACLSCIRKRTPMTWSARRIGCGKSGPTCCGCERTACRSSV